MIARKKCQPQVANNSYPVWNMASSLFSILCWKQTNSKVVATLQLQKWSTTKSAPQPLSSHLSYFSHYSHVKPLEVVNFLLLSPGITSLLISYKKPIKCVLRPDYQNQQIISIRAGVSHVLQFLQGMKKSVKFSKLTIFERIGKHLFELSENSWKTHNIFWVLWRKR